MNITPLSPVRLVLAGTGLLLLGLIGIVPWRVTTQTRTAVPPTPFLSTLPALAMPVSGSSADVGVVPAETSDADAKALKARAGNYTILLEKTALVNNGVNTEAREIQVGGVHFKPNLAVYLKILGRRSDHPMLVGLSPQVAAVAANSAQAEPGGARTDTPTKIMAAAIDTNGAQAEPSPLTFPERLSNAANTSSGVLVLRLPNTGVGTLQSLEGSLLIYDGKLNRLDLPAKEWRGGTQKPFGAMMLQVDSFHASTSDAGRSTVETDLSLTWPMLSIDPALLTQNPHLPTEILMQNAASLRAELRDTSGHVYPSTALSFTLHSTAMPPAQDNRGVPKGNDGPTRQTIHLTFQLPVGAKSPQTLMLSVAARTGKTQRLPFRFTQVPLPSPQ